MVGAVLETPGVTSVLVERPDGMPCPRFRPGQFVTMSVSGRRTRPVPLSSDPDAVDHLGLTLTGWDADPASVDEIDAGDRVELSAPAGPSWPLEAAGGSHLVVVAAGFGMAWVRSLVIAAARNRSGFASIGIAASFPTPGEMLFRRDLERWRAGGLRVWTTVDEGNPGRDGWVGPIGTLLPAVLPGRDARVVIAGPPRFVAEVTAALPPEVAAGRIWSRSVGEAVPAGREHGG